MYLLKKSDGFTLVEVIISIAILSVASVVALQLFITSQDMNKDSRHADIASVQATNMIEELRAFDDLESLLKNMTYLKATDFGYGAELYLDHNFKALDPKTDPTNDGAYLLTCQMVKTQQGLYEVLVAVKEIESDKELASYTTNHYFKKEVTNHDL